MEQDKELVCAEPSCGETFIVTVSEQRFYTDKGLYLPKRCAKCREKRRREKEQRTGGQ